MTEFLCDRAFSKEISIMQFRIRKDAWIWVDYIHKVIKVHYIYRVIVISGSRVQDINKQVKIKHGKTR